VALALGVFVIVRPGISTSTVMTHRGSVLPAGQLLPGAVVTSVMDRTGLPVVRVVDDDRAGDRHGAADRDVPVHTAPSVPTDRVPELAVWSPPLVPSLPKPGALKVTLIPKYGSARYW